MTKINKKEAGIGAYLKNNISVQLGSGWESVGRPVTSETRDTRFESSHWQILIYINCIEKTKMKKTIALT